MLVCFFFNDTATAEIYTLSLHDALPIWRRHSSAWAVSSFSNCSPISRARVLFWNAASRLFIRACTAAMLMCALLRRRSEEHTSELQSRQYLVCRLLLEKKTQS